MMNAQDASATLHHPASTQLPATTTPVGARAPVSSAADACNAENMPGCNRQSVSVAEPTASTPLDTSTKPIRSTGVEQPSALPHALAEQMQVPSQQHANRLNYNSGEELFEVTTSSYPDLQILDEPVGASMLPDSSSGEASQEGKVGSGCMLASMGHSRDSPPMCAPPAAKAAFDARMHDAEVFQPPSGTNKEPWNPHSLSAGVSAAFKDQGVAFAGAKEVGAMKVVPAAAGQQTFRHPHGMHERMMPTPYMGPQFTQGAPGAVMIAIKRSACNSLGSLPRSIQHTKFQKLPHGAHARMVTTVQHSMPVGMMNPVATAAQFLMGAVPSMHGSDQSSGGGKQFPSCMPSECVASLKSTGRFESAAGGSYFLPQHGAEIDFDPFKDSPVNTTAPEHSMQPMQWQLEYGKTC